MYLHWSLICLVTTFFDSGLCANFKRFDRTTYMSEVVWNEKKFDFSTKTSLITCIAYCMSWSGTGSEKICNAVSYDKGIEITKAITLLERYIAKPFLAHFKIQPGNTFSVSS